MKPGYRLKLFLLLASTSLVSTACTDKPAPSAKPGTATGPAPDSFLVRFETSRGPFVVQVKRALAPNGADRFHQLVAEGFFDDNRFFRVVPGFIAQFGVGDDRKLNEAWDAKKMADDPVRETNARGTLSFAHEGPNTRTHQVFINYANNTHLDKEGFAPFGRVVEGMSVVDSIYGGYGEKPDYHYLATIGNSYLRRMFPKLDYIMTARIVEGGAAPK